MNASLKSLAVQAPVYVKNAKLVSWVAEMAATVQAGANPLV